MKPSFARSAALVLFLVLAGSVLARPRPPLLPFPEPSLKSWKFDVPDYVTAEAMGAHVATNLWLAESWSGYSLYMAASEGSLLLTPAVAGTRINFKATNGTIRMWFAPNWASASAGGSGPGDWATLFELGQTNAASDFFNLVIAIDPKGTNLFAAVSTPLGTIPLVQHPIAWSTGVWHQVAFAYWSNGVALVVDDTPETLSLTVPVWPGATLWNQSAFSLASDLAGQHSARGQVDEIFTFGLALSTNYLTETYEYYAPIAALGPLPDEEGGGMQTSSMPNPCDPCPEGDTNGGPKYLGGWTTNAGLKFASNPAPYITTNMNYVTVLDGAIPTKAYQIFQTTRLLSNKVVSTNVFWTLAANGAVGVSNFSLPLPPTNMAYFLAAETRDTDDDGLSDAYELLINQTTNRTAPATYWNSRDSDGDGIDDNHLSLYFELKDPPESGAGLGNFIRGPGFKVWGGGTNTGGEPHGDLWFQFQQTYRGLPLNVWTGDGRPDVHDSKVIFKLPGATGTFVKYLVKYDLRNIWLSVSNGATPLANVRFWRDNMTETLGADGPNPAWVTNAAWMTNFSYKAATFPRRVRYVWEGAIGNTSQEFAGPSVHSPWWPILKMVSRGTNVFYTGAYNEGKWDVMKMFTSNHQFVLTNVSRDGRKYLAGPIVTNLALPSGNTLYAKYSDGAVYGYNVTTCSNMGSGFTFPALPTVGFSTNGYREIALHPENSNIAALYYTNREQVVVYTNAQSTSPTVLFTIGRVNGYSNGPSISVPTNTPGFRTNDLKLCSYYFDSDDSTRSDDNRVYRPVLCFQSDGKLWVSDTATSRMLRFDASGLCDAWFMFVAHSYTASANPNDPKRVFMGYLEFEVDYTKPLKTGWKLTNYWGRESSTGRPETARGAMTDNGLYTVVTLTNGGTTGTYALIRDPAQGNRKRVVELTTSGVRPTTATNLHPLSQLERDGSMLSLTISPNEQNGTNANFFRDYITSWSGADPIYTSQAIGSVRYTDNVHPVSGNNVKTNGSTVYLFFPSRFQLSETNYYTGRHLGAVSAGNPGTWLWTNAPSGQMNGRGNFDTTNVAPDGYAGSTHTVIDDNIFLVYRGEGWLTGDGGKGQANQIFHYKTNGTFVGQFGMPRFVDGTVDNPPGGAGNLGGVSAVKVNGVIYLYTSDEWSHGVHRWRIDNP